MKKISQLLLILFALYGCVGTPTKTNKKFSNIQQNNFHDMLIQNKNEMRSSLGNDILRKEFDDSVRLAMGEYIDSVKLFVNWEANIKDIKSVETGKSIALSFRLEIPFDIIDEIIFDAVYVLPQDSINNDKIYQTIRNTGNYSTVYFDGFIRKKANGEAYYKDTGYNIHIYPEFEFFVVDINTTSKGDTLSNNLQNAVDLAFQSIEPLELNLKKEISKKEADKRVDGIIPRFLAAKEVLTQEEKAYIDRLTQALTYNFLYAQ
ncbi:MAG: hypothetical protein J6V18_01310 [Bacteroidales bacterium]|nr:hypothetical protein [Bacteroidales bacterium]